MLRGVSGGKCKRVTTGEMSFGIKKVHLMDEISTGLDSPTTFDIVTSLKSMAVNFKTTVVISLLQPSPEVFAMFDDVLILNDGHIMFQGDGDEGCRTLKAWAFTVLHDVTKPISSWIWVRTGSASTVRHPQRPRLDFLPRGRLLQSISGV